MPTTDTSIRTGSVSSNPNETILIVGASARYIAQSAKIAGMNPIAIDLFADWDLKQVAEVSQVDALSNITARNLNAFSSRAACFLISGGMEFREEVLRCLQRAVVFSGPPVDQLAQTQDPFVVSSCCRENGLSFPPIRDWKNLPQNTEKTWLLKPQRGAGGHGIKHWGHKSNASPEFFLQQHIDGSSYSALFAHNGSKTTLLGITHQLVGLQPFTRHQFAYCGSVGPIHFSDPLQQETTRLGNCVASRFELVGCFGIDLVVDKYDKVWLIEINPRITASAEVLELAGSVESIAKIHINGCRQASVPDQEVPNSMIGKAIVYSHQDGTFSISPKLFDLLTDRSIYHGPTPFLDESRFATADIPSAGTVIQPGHPIVSVFCTGSDSREVKSKLMIAAHFIHDQIKKLANKTSASL